MHYTSSNANQDRLSNILLPFPYICISISKIVFDFFAIAGQHYRIHGDPAKGLPFLFKAARMPFPDRSVFNWHHLYKCLSKLELGRAVTSLGDSQVTLAELKDAAQLIGQVQKAAWAG